MALLPRDDDPRLIDLPECCVVGGYKHAGSDEIHCGPCWDDLSVAAEEAAAEARAEDAITERNAR